jgi:predicted DsbA family dithiol-disulfide isomerase
VKLEVFFDYTCPYCLRGHENLMAVRKENPALEIEWRPCEAHPRPEDWPPHSDIAIRGMFFTRDNGGDLDAYHSAVYRTHFEEKRNVEDPAVIAACVKEAGCDPGAFTAAIAAGEYVGELNRANDYAYEQSGVWAVPAYRLNGKKLDAVENVGVSLEQLRAFVRYN